MSFRNFQLRLKIEAIISKSAPVPDSDCPDDPESVRFWCTCGGRSSQKETTKVSATAETTVAPSAEGLSQLMGGGGEIGAPGTSSTCSVGNRPTIKALVDIANSETPAAAPPAASKAKAKGKAKAKVAAKKPSTPAEQRTAIRF